MSFSRSGAKYGKIDSARAILPASTAFAHHGKEKFGAPPLHNARRVLVASSASLSTCQVYSLLTDVATWSLRGLIHKMYISWSVPRACRHCYRCWGGSLHLCMRIAYTRIYTNDGEISRMRANVHHYCNFVNGNDEKWLVKRLTAALIGHRSFARVSSLP